MGHEGAHINSYIDNLRHEMTCVRLESIKYEDYGPLWVLRDLRKHIPKEVVLAEKITKQLNERESQGLSWPLTDLGAYMAQYCAACMSMGGNGKTAPSGQKRQKMLKRQ